MEFRTDSTNADTRLTRNRIRAELLPQLAEQYNPAVAGLLASTAAQLRDAADLITNQALHAAEHFVEPVQGGFAIAVRALRQMPRAVRTELVHSLVARHFGRALSAAQVRTFERFLIDPNRPRPSLGRGIGCEAVFDRIVICRTRPPSQHDPVEVAVPGITIHHSLNTKVATTRSPRPADWHAPSGPTPPFLHLWQRAEAGEALDLTRSSTPRALTANRLCSGHAARATRCNRLVSAASKRYRTFLWTKSCPLRSEGKSLYSARTTG